MIPFCGIDGRGFCCYIPAMNGSAENRRDAETILRRELDHLSDVLAGARVPVGREHIQRGQVGEERAGVEVGDVLDAAALLGRRHLELVLAGVGVGYRVAHVGDVDDVPDRDLLPAQGATERVGEHVGPHVAQVREVVDGRAAAVQADDIGGRHEVLELPSERVIDL